MSARADTAQTGSAPAERGSSGADRAADPAGTFFRRLTVLPALLAASWLLVGLPLLLLGHFTPLLMLVTSVPVAAVLVYFGMRWESGRSEGLLGQLGAAPARTPWWAVIAVIVIAVAFGVDQFIYHSQYILVSQDPASYVQFGNWIARHGSLPIPQDTAAFGGPSKLLSFYTPAFYQVGHAIVPQFMAGEPMAIAAAFWIGGINLAVATNTLIGACGVLVFGGLVGRLVGPRWAPLGALILALSWPQQYTARETLSEPLAQVLFLGGLCLLIDSFARDGIARRGVAALAGLVMGLTLLVRIDGASDMLPLIPYCGLLVLGRKRQAWPLIVGIVAGSAYGAVDGLVLSRPYLASIRSSLVPLVAIGIVILVGTAVAVLVLWQRGVPTLRTDRLPNLAAALAFLITLGFIIRPYVQTTYGSAPAGQLLSTEEWQRAEHLPVQPYRTYYEISMHWVFWYVGIPIVILGTVGAAVLARRCLRGKSPVWTLPLMSFAWIIFSVLWRPAIIAEQPWASRRLVPGVLPGFIIFAVWAASWLFGWLRQRRTRPLFLAGAAVVVGAAMILPAVKTTFGIAHQHGGPLGIRLVAVGMAFRPVERGEIAAVDKLCAALPANSSVLFVGGIAETRFAPAVRGMCGLPAAVVRSPDKARLATLTADVRRAGRQPVLLGSTEADVRPYGGRVTHVVHLRTQADAHTLEAPPVFTNVLTVDVWMAENPK